MLRATSVFGMNGAGRTVCIVFILLIKIRRRTRFRCSSVTARDNHLYLRTTPKILFLVVGDAPKMAPNNGGPDTVELRTPDDFYAAILHSVASCRHSAILDNIRSARASIFITAVCYRTEVPRTPHATLIQHLRHCCQTHAHTSRDAFPHTLQS